MEAQALKILTLGPPPSPFNLKLIFKIKRLYFYPNFYVLAKS